MSMRIDVKFEGLDELMRDVRRAGGNAQPLVKAALQNSAGRTRSNIRAKAPHRTGALQRSVLEEVRYPDAKVAVNEKYGVYVEQGTGIYGPKRRKIVPGLGKRALRFKSGGKIVFASSVRGMRARPFFKPGFDQSKPYIKQQFEKVTEILVRELAGRR